MRVYTTLIATVGASLRGNIMRNEELKEKYENGRLSQIAKDFYTEKFGDPENERIYGSEINSTVSLIKNFQKIESEAKFIPDNLYLLVSDTELGEQLGSILKEFFENNKNYKFGTVIVKRVKHLTDKDEIGFKKFGLRNVVREFAKIARTHKESVVVNSTGGYKAQIAFALALGQALKFPVYYRFETFRKIIKMPPLPVSLDWHIYVKHHEFLEALESNAEMTENEFLKQFNIRDYSEIPEVLKVFIDREKVDSDYYLWLSPMGQVFLEASRELIKLNLSLDKSKNDPKDKLLAKNKESHSLEFMNAHNEIVKLSNINWIDKIRIQAYDKGLTQNVVKVKIKDGELYVKYGDKGGTLKFIISTTARNDEELLLAKNELLKYFGVTL